MGSITKVRKPPHHKTFGMEVECIPNVPFGEGQRVGFWEATYDASLSYAGVEFVSQPMPYNMLIKQINQLDKRVGRWTVDHRCGLHIHVSRQYWSAVREEAFSAFLRTTTRTQRTVLFGRDSSYARVDYCKREKYRAINHLHPHTYEFRLWEAGDLAWTLEALRRTKLIVEYKGQWSYDKCLELFTEPDKPFIEAAQIPAVRRIRRAPAVPV